MTSAPKLEQCPPDEGGEVVFAGRSNAGKSSAINRLTGQKNLARTSKTPGRTQLINFFRLDDVRRLVDLPGYGYAKVEKRKRNEWQKHLSEYLARRHCLHGMILLMDCRHPLKDYDLMLVDWANTARVPLHILLTKADKLKYGAAKQTLLKTHRELSNLGVDIPLSLQLFSATKDLGWEEAWEVLGEWLDVPTEEEKA